jgi:hypothetical protein
MLFASSTSSTEGIITALRKGEYHRFKELQSEPASERDQLRADVYYCEKCQRKGYLTLTRVIPQDDDETEEEVVASLVTIGPAVGNLLRDFPAEVS